MLLDIIKLAKLIGQITGTSKAKWRQTDFLGPIKQALKIPIYFTMDVNAAVYGQYVTSHLYNEKIVSLVYYTIGTGVGGGLFVTAKFFKEQRAS